LKLVNPIEIQKIIATLTEKERQLMEGKKLVEIYTQKIETELANFG